MQRIFCYAALSIAISHAATADAATRNWIDRYIAAHGHCTQQPTGPFTAQNPMEKPIAEWTDEDLADLKAALDRCDALPEEQTMVSRMWTGTLYEHYAALVHDQQRRVAIQEEAKQSAREQAEQKVEMAKRKAAADKVAEAERIAALQRAADQEVVERKATEERKQAIAEELKAATRLAEETEARAAAARAEAQARYGVEAAKRRAEEADQQIRNADAQARADRQAADILVGRGTGMLEFPIRYGIIETAARRILVDTGYGPRVTAGSRTLALSAYAKALSIRLAPFDVSAIDTVLLTHLHADHVARLRDLGPIRILASRKSIDALKGLSVMRSIASGIFAELLPHDLSRRYDAVENLSIINSGTSLGDGADVCGDGSHLAIPLPGHAPGHLGILWWEEGRPTLYATDAAWTLDALRSRSTPRLSRGAVFDDARAGVATEERILAFERHGGRVLLCHDPAPLL